jgi:hypothetical protein
MKNGIAYIAFGENYAKLGYSTIKYSRQYTDLPITVFVNSDSGAYDWAALGVDVVKIDMPTSENRQVKTSLPDYTPYDTTLYIDVDSVVSLPELETIFQIIGDKEILFQKYGTWKPGDKFADIYRRACVKTGTDLPLPVYYGGFIAFRKTVNVKAFFKKWNECWRLTGSGREMPALACAAKAVELDKMIIKKEQKIFTVGKNAAGIVRHRSGSGDLMQYGAPRYHANKPWDRPGDWKQVFYQ